MSSFRKTLLTGLFVSVGAASAIAQTAPATYGGIGRAATPKEVQAWDIDVRPDFKGLPAGSGSVAQGMVVWEAKCASCHGIFGESNEVFSPLVGGTTKEDVKTGRVARLNDRGYPGRTTLMKVATVSTLWDYIRRAMPWNAPKSLTTDEVYAVTAYLLHLGEVLPDDFVMSNQNIAQVQALMPNRNGMSTDHGLWPGKSLGNDKGQGAQPDVQMTACMRDCEAEPKLASFLPDFARNAHGNLADQNRLVGAQHGAVTAAPAAPMAPVAPVPPTASATSATAPSAAALAGRLSCTACHGMDNKIVGPGFSEVARKYAGRADAQAYLAAKIKSGGQGVWGGIPMPPQTLSDADAKTLAQWIAAGAKK